MGRKGVVLDADVVVLIRGASQKENDVPLRALVLGLYRPELYHDSSLLGHVDQKIIDQPRFYPFFYSLFLSPRPCPSPVSCFGIVFLSHPSISLACIYSILWSSSSILPSHLFWRFFKLPTCTVLTILCPMCRGYLPRNLYLPIHSRWSVRPAWATTHPMKPPKLGEATAA